MKLSIVLLAVSFAINLLASETVSLPFTSTVRVGEDKTEVAFADPMYVITEVTVTEIATPLVYRALEEKGTLDDIAMTLDKLIALGKKVWKIIEDNKPVLNTDFTQSISVIPQVQGESDPDITFSLMSGWELPKAKSYQVVYTNAFGMKVITFDYTVTFQYGGKFNGVGNYLTGINVFAQNIAVSWGFDFNAKTTLVTISNHGTVESPVAGATLKIDYQTNSVIRTIHSTQLFHITGLGKIIQVK